MTLFFIAPAISLWLIVLIAWAFGFGGLTLGVLIALAGAASALGGVAASIANGAMSR